MGQTQSQNMPVTTTQPFVEEIDHRQITKKELLGKGTFGEVYKAVWKNQTVAVKYIEQNEDDLIFTKREVGLLSRVKHPNIVHLYGVYTQKPHVCLVMELAEGGSLYNLLHSNPHMYTIGHAMNWAMQCAKGVAHLHAMTPKPVVHRDLKSLNLLVFNDGTVIKICDFGTATEKRTLMSLEKGTIAYMAPEVFQVDKYTEKCDVYSWGIVLWELVSRQKPYKEMSSQQAIMYSVGIGNRPQLINKCPKPIENLMTTCWHENADNRPSMSDVVDQMVELCEYFYGGEIPLLLQTQNPLVEVIDHREISKFSLVGKGTFGKVYKAMWENQYVAVKYIDFESHSFMGSRIVHLNIVRLFGMSRLDLKECLVMEFCDTISLYNVLKLKVQYSTAHAMSWMKQCAEAVAFLHSMIPKPFLHRNLKTTNLFLFNNGTLLKICPVGTKGTAFQYMDELGATEYTEKSDVYHWSIILLEVVQKAQPLNLLPIEELLLRFMYDIEKWSMYDIFLGRPVTQNSGETFRFIATCWDWNPANRPLMHEIVKTIKDLCKSSPGGNKPLDIPYITDKENHHQGELNQIRITDYVSYMSKRLEEIMCNIPVYPGKITEIEQDFLVKFLNGCKVVGIDLSSKIISVINELSEKKSNRDKLISGDKFTSVPWFPTKEMELEYVTRPLHCTSNSEYLSLPYITESFEEFFNFLIFNQRQRNTSEIHRYNEIFLNSYRKQLSEQLSEIKTIINQYSEIERKIDELLVKISVAYSLLDLQQG